MDRPPTIKHGSVNTTCKTPLTTQCLMQAGRRLRFSWCCARGATRCPWTAAPAPSSTSSQPCRRGSPTCSPGSATSTSPASRRSAAGRRSPSSGGGTLRGGGRGEAGKRPGATPTAPDGDNSTLGKVPAVRPKLQGLGVPQGYQFRTTRRMQFQRLRKVHRVPCNPNSDPCNEDNTQEQFRAARSILWAVQGSHPTAKKSPRRKNLRE